MTKKYLALCTILLSLVCSTKVIADPSRTYVSDYDLDPSVGESDSFSIFLDILQTGSIMTVEEFLSVWKTRDPLLFRYYLLAYRSRSLQEATPENPRAVLFHPSADFAAAFNGHSSQKGFQQIEMYRFNYQQNKFEFYELSFAENQKPRLSEANPRKCLDCHQSLGRVDVDPRPNWEPYFMWPGFFGSAGDHTFKSINHLFPSMKEKMDPVADAIMLQEIPLEQERYDRFQQRRSQHPRYKFLAPFNKDLAELEVKLYGHHARTDLKTLMYTQRVAQINFRRVSRIIKEDKELFSYLKEAVVVALSCSSGALPDAFTDWLSQNSSLKKNGFDPRNLNLGDRIKLLFEPFYFDTDDWSMDFKTNGKFAFSNRFGTPGTPDIELFSALHEPDMGKIDCRTVKSSELMKKYNDLEIARKLQQRRLPFKESIDKFKNTPLIQRCFGCHVNPTADTPEIPFDSANQLKNALKKVGYKRGTLLDEIIYRTGAHAESTDQMPPRGVPTAHQHTELIEYLKSL
ncbi:hypothetical protein K2X05_07670 [bacterium]|nr:hypothetical protein [bacterium]